MKYPKKSLSQNFLTDNNICKKITNLTEIKNKFIIEIGPGYGFMTDHILKKNPKKLILIEKDNYLKVLLKKKYKNNKIIEIIGQDILKFNLNKFKQVTIISNLPYNVSTKIILYLFKYNQNITEMIFMIQKEVAIKFDYNLAVMNKYKFLTKIFSIYERCFNVSSDVFFPKPKVQSTVVKFIFIKKIEETSRAFKFSNIIFKNIRKKISNNIDVNIGNKVLLDKRVGELTLNEILYIYNFF